MAAKEKKGRTQYNWKFKDTETEEFYQWFDNQENITNSLRSILYHIIELYGTGNILDPGIQKQMVTNSLKLESLKDKNVFFINPLLPNKESTHTANNDMGAAALDSGKLDSSKEKSLDKNSEFEKVPIENSTEKQEKTEAKNDIYSNLNEGLL